VSPEDLFREWHGSNPDVDMYDRLPNVTESDRVRCIGHALEITYEGKWDAQSKFVHYHETKPRVGDIQKRGGEFGITKFMTDGCSVTYLGRLRAFVYEDLDGYAHVIQANPRSDEMFAVNTGVILLTSPKRKPLFLYGGSGKGLRITAEGIAG